MSHTDLSSPRTILTDSSTPMYYGRAETVAAILDNLASQRDVIVEGETGLGKSMLRATVARVVRAEGWRTIRLDQPATVSGGERAIVITDLDTLSSADLNRLSELQRVDGVRLFATRRPPHPFASTSSQTRAPIISRATTITLMPLTLAQCDALIEEQVGITPMPTEPTLVERRWIWAQSGGFPRIAMSLLQSLSEAPVEEDSLSTPSRRTLIEASSVLAGLPPALQRFAGSLLPLVGVSFTRIRRFFNRVELSLLIESHVISDHRDTLCIPGPIQAALRMMTEPEMTPLAQDIIADICASVVIDAECTESEVGVAARALTIDATLRALIDSDAQLAVLSMAMWLSRRRGESEQAAALARRILTMHPAATSDGLLRTARQEGDDFERLTADLRAGMNLPVSDLCLWALCLQIPLTSGAEGVDELLVEIGVQSARIDRYGLETHRASLVAAAALDRGEFDEALRLTAPLLVPSHRDTLAALRAYSVDSLVHAQRLDHAALRATAEGFAQLATATTFERGLKADLTRRMTLDALTVIACAFGAAGQLVPSSIEQVTDRFLTEGLLHDDLSMSTSATICHLISAAQHDQQKELHGGLRFLTRESRTDTSAWVLAAVAGREPAPLFSPVTSALSQAVSLVLALTVEMQRGQHTFTEAIDALPDQSIPLTRLAQQFIATAATGATGATAQVDEIAGLEDATIPGAMVDFCIGVANADPMRLRRAAFTFQSMGGGEQAQAALTALAPLVSGDHAFEKSLRPLKRTVSSRLRAMEEKAEPLTPREYEIALLAAQGHRNADIAQRLFLSVRTVESHLYRAMRKLAVDRKGLHPSVLLRIGIES